MTPPSKLPVDGVVEVDGEEHDLADVYGALRIDPVHIIEQLQEQPALYAYWATLSEAADDGFYVARKHLEFVEAAMDEKVREDAREADEKVTEAMVQRRILRETKYQDALDDVIVARSAAGYLGAFKRALEQRLVVLSAINNRDRAELSVAGREG